MADTRSMHNQIIADKADNITWGASAITMLSAVVDYFHTHFGWLFSTSGLAFLSVLLGVISALVGLHYRRRDAKYARAREMRERAAFNASMAREHGPNWREEIGWQGYESE